MFAITILAVDFESTANGSVNMRGHNYGRNFCRPPLPARDIYDGMHHCINYTIN